MKKSLALLLLFLVSHARASGQRPSEIAALDSLLRTDLPDSARALDLSLMCFHLSANSPDSARMFGERGLALARKTGAEKIIGSCEANLGWLEFRQGNFAVAKNLLGAAASRFRKLGATDELMSAISNLGAVAMRESDYPTAFRYYEEFLALAEKAADRVKIGYGYKNFAGLYRAQGNFPEAEKYLHQALAIFEKAARADLVFEATQSLGNLRFERQDFAGALSFYQKALSNAGETISEYQHGLTFENIALALVPLRRFPEALAWFAKSEAVFQKLNDRNELTYLRGAIGSAYLEMGDLSRAAAEFERARRMAAENHFTDLELNALAKLQETAVLAGDYRAAFLANQRAQTLRDSLRQNDRDRELLALQTKFETAQKEKELQAKTLEAAHLRSVAALGALGLVVLGLLAAMLWWRAHHRRRTAEQLLVKNLEIEAARARAERSEAAKKQFLANMSHEIRTPLNALVGISNLLAEQPASDEKTARYHEILQKSSETLLAIVNDILDYSKIEAGKLRLDPAPFCLPELLRLVADTFRQKAAEKNIALETRLAPELPQWVFADRHYLAQVLNNLLSNAIKFTPDGGRVLLEGAFLKSSNPRILLKISDTGIGIPPEKLPLVFESFEQADASATRRHGGTGLGLAIARDIVALMGGQMQVKSVPGAGTEFWFEVEMLEIEPPENQALVASAAQRATLRLAAPVRVLLAEDNLYNQVVARDSLARLSENFHVSTANDGREALHFLEKNACDLLLLDVQMPVMDGYELTQRLRKHPDERLRRLPIVALTASVIRTDVERCRAAGMNGYVPKPFQINELSAELARVLPEKISLMAASQPRSRLTSLAEFEHLTAELSPSERERMRHLLAEGLAEKIAPLDAARHTGDRAAFAKIVHALRPLTISAGMAAAQNLMTELENAWPEMPAETWSARAEHFAETLRQAVQELHNAL